MNYLTSFIKLVELLASTYKKLKKEKKKEELKDEVRKRDDDDTIANLRDAGL